MKVNNIKVKRRLNYECLVARTKHKSWYQIGYTIQIKAFGLFWIDYKKYSITCFK